MIVARKHVTWPLSLSIDLRARTSAVRGIGLVGPQQVQGGSCSSEHVEVPKPQEAKARKTKAPVTASPHSAQLKVEGEGLQNDDTKHQAPECAFSIRAHTCQQVRSCKKHLGVRVQVSWKGAMGR